MHRIIVFLDTFALTVILLYETPSDYGNDGKVTKRYCLYVLILRTHCKESLKYSNHCLF